MTLNIKQWSRGVYPRFIFRCPNYSRIFLVLFLFFCVSFSSGYASLGYSNVLKKSTGSNGNSDMDTSFKASITTDTDYKLIIYQHPTCNLKECSEMITYKYRNTIWNYQNKEDKALIKNKYNLTHDESISLWMYTSELYRIYPDLNMVLSTGSASVWSCYMDYFLSAFKKINEYERNNNIKNNLILYSGINSYSVSNIIVDNVCKLNKGQIIVMPSIGSTSLQKSTAYGFASGGLVLNITTLGKNTKSIPVDSFSEFSEDEYIFPPGTRFRVTSNCEMKPKTGMYSVELIELDDNLEYYSKEVDNNDNEFALTICNQCSYTNKDYCKHCDEPNKCSICYDGYGIDSTGKCVKCDDNCKTCDGTNVDWCLSCYNEMGLINKVCTNCTDSGCLKCDGDANKCEECKKGYTLKEGRCILCEDKWCERCETENVCTKCIGPTIENNGKCEDCEIDNCAECSMVENKKKCVRCNEGYDFDKEGTCKICSNLFRDEYYEFENCDKCSFNENNSPKECTTCISPYYLINGRCVDCKLGYLYNPSSQKCEKCKVNGCMVCDVDNKCFKCFDGYRLNYVGECEKCETNNCRKCDLNKEVCSQCFDYTSPQSGDQCGCDINDEQCTSCSIDEESGKMKCDECASWYTLDNGICKFQLGKALIIIASVSLALSFISIIVVITLIILVPVLICSWCCKR